MHVTTLLIVHRLFCPNKTLNAYNRMKVLNQLYIGKASSPILLLYEWGLCQMISGVMIVKSGEKF